MHRRAGIELVSRLVAAVLAGTAAAAGQTVKEFDVPTPRSGLREIAAGPDGALWFTEQNASKIGRITTEGVVTEFSVPGGRSPWAIVAGPDGAMWFTEGTPRIGRITMDGAVTEFPLRDGTAASAIAVGPDGALWFTETNEGKIGRITTEGSVGWFPVQNQSTFNYLRSIISGPDGALWYRGTEELGRMATDGTIRVYSRFGVPGGIVAGADGAVWFPSCGLFPTFHCSMERIPTAASSGTAESFSIGNTDFNRGVSGPDGAIWFTSTESVHRFSLDGNIRHFPIPTANGLAEGIAAGPDGALWFTEYSGNKIGRVSGISPAAPVLSLQGGDFEIEATWRAPDGSSGVGQPVRLTDESGYFWFFEPGNVEIVVKALNGCSINGHTWFFAAGLTNVEVELAVTSIATRETRYYTNPSGAAFQPILDTGAFACAASPSSAASEVFRDSSGAIPRVSPDSPGGCAAGDTVLCVNGRFQIEATWQTDSGASGPARARTLTSESGYFWFFEPGNVELVVKLLDACPIGLGRWFFAAGLTNVGVDLTVTDTATGQAATYSNPVGTPFAPVLDTGTFLSSCPAAAATERELGLPE